MYVHRDIIEVVDRKVPNYYQHHVLSVISHQVSMEVQRVTSLPARPKRREPISFNTSTLPPSGLCLRHLFGVHELLLISFKDVLISSLLYCNTVEYMRSTALTAVTTACAHRTGAAARE